MSWPLLTFKSKHMKRFSGNFAYLIIEPTDLYFNEVHGKWFPVPKHWVGDFDRLIAIQSNHPIFNP